MNALTLDIRRKVYRAHPGAPARLILEGLKLDVRRGEMLCLLGPSGCGKTTLLNMIAGLDRDFEGRIDIRDETDQRLAYMFQTPRLLPWRTVLENVVLACGDAPGAVESSRKVLAEVGLAGFENAWPGQLSLGMQRRAALARAFAARPTILLLDEPFVSLDEPAAEKLRALLIALLGEHPATVLFVTHDLREALLVSDRLILLSSPPARVIRDMPCPLPPAQRSDPVALESRRAAILRDMRESFFCSAKDYTKDRAG